ncbi:unnamed protein product [Ixodes persulcatus]
MPGLQYTLSAFPRAGARNSRDAEVSSKVGSLCRWRDNRKTHLLSVSKLTKPGIA